MSKRDKMVWFERLREARKQRGLSIAEFCPRVGLGPVHFGAIERQESGTPKIRALMIARELGKTLHQLGAYRRHYY